MRARVSTLCLAAAMGAVSLVAGAAPAKAAWQDQYGYWHHGPPPYAYGPPAVVYVPQRVWVPPHWWGGVWVPGHWR